MTIKELIEENERLRGLLRRSVPYIIRPNPSGLRLQLIESIKEEVGDEGGWVEDDYDLGEWKDLYNKGLIDNDE